MLEFEIIKYFFCLNNTRNILRKRIEYDFIKRILN